MKKVLSMVLVVALLSMSAVALADTYGLGVFGLADSHSKAATAEAAGNAQADTTVCAVVLDAEGKIVAVHFDVIQQKIAFNDKGELVTEVGTEFKTKRELGDEYGMKGNSGIGAEWNTQAAAFAASIIGMTADEVAGIALNEEGAVTDEELASQVTVGVDGFLACVASAAATAK